jgi:hypothetical protein
MIKNISQCCKQIWTHCFSVVVTYYVVSYCRFLSTGPVPFRAAQDFHDALVIGDADFHHIRISMGAKIRSLVRHAGKGPIHQMLIPCIHFNKITALYTRCLSYRKLEMLVYNYLYYGPSSELIESGDKQGDHIG